MEKFIELFKEATDIEQEMQPTDEFRKYEDWDSLAYLSVIAMMDEEYGVQIEEAEFKQLRTIQDLFNAVTKR